MQLENYEIKWDVEDGVSFLTLVPKDDRRLNDYLLQMLGSNEIVGLLPMSRRSIDGVLSLRYEIGGLQRISDVPASVFTESAQKAVLKSVVKTLKLLPEYFLSESLCVFNKDYLFLDDSCCASLLCLPVEPSEADFAEVTDFLRDIIRTYFTDDAGNIKSAYAERLERALSKDKLGLDKLYIAAECDDEPEDEDVIEPIKETPEMPDRQQKLLKHSAAEKAAEIVEKANKVIANDNIDGIAIPGFEASPEKKKDKKKKAKSEKEEKVKADKKSGKLFGGLFHKGKNAEEADPAADEEPDFAVPQDEEKVFNMTVHEELKLPVRQTPVHAAPPPAPKQDDVPEEEQFDGTVAFAPPVGAYVQQPSARLVYNGESFKINKSTYSIGRIQSDLIIKSIYVSHHHAKITFSDGDYYVEDLNSKNRTCVDSVPLIPYTKHKLHDHAQIIVADRILEFIIGD